jgi:hypothetical protein
MTAEFNFTAVRPCIKCGASDRKSNGTCGPCSRARDSARYAENPQKSALRSAAWHARNADKKRLSDAAKYLQNTESIKKSQAAYRKSNPEPIRLRWQNRRAKKISSGSRLSRGLEKKLFSLQKGMCPCCGEVLGENYHMDHITPLALGGENSDANIQLLRSVCNLQKHAKHPIDFMQSRGFLL